jgi:predicted cupin superfamily sugar epimerase
VKTVSTAEDVSRLFDLRPLTIEGGYFRETYRSIEQFTPAGYAGSRCISTAIYYFLTPETFSEMHIVPGDEIFHFYLGDPVEMLQVAPDGTANSILLGNDLAAGMQPQHVVPGGYWQGARLREGGTFALLGTTMSPGFDYADYRKGNRTEMLGRFPQHGDKLLALTRE